MDIIIATSIWKIIFFFQETTIYNKKSFMINFSNAISTIRDNHGFKANQGDSSFYRTYTISGGQYLQVRISNHGTNLQTWIERDYDPSNAIANISIVFSKDGECDSNVNVDLGDKKRTYTITQYVYDCSKLNDNDVLRINMQISDIVRNKTFIDPLAETDKRAKVYELRPNEDIHIIKESEQIRNMKKNTIRLNENRLREIVRDVMNETLNNFNGYLYHNTSMENLVRMMKSNSISSSYHRGYREGKSMNGICFTRNKYYVPYTFYNVRIEFDTNYMLSYARGLRLIPYQDPSWEGLDEYEERLVSKDGNPFTLKLSCMVTEVTINMESLCDELLEGNGGDEQVMREYIYDLENIVKNNIFGNRLKIVDNFKNMRNMSFEDAVEYIKRMCSE